LTKLSNKYENYNRLAFGLDEGKVHIRSKEKKKETNKYEYYWMNVKLGIVYPFDENGNKCGSSLQIAEIEKKMCEFKESDLKKLLSLSKYEKANDKITLSDGALGYIKLLKDICPNSYHILDAMHLKEHMWILAKLIYPDENGKTSPKAEKFVNYNYEILKEKGVLNLLTSLNIDKPKAKCSKKKLKIWNREINYIKNNISRLDYPEYIIKKFPLGSGVVESSIKYVCNKRLKNGSPIWLLESVNGLLKLRIIYFNKFYDDFWLFRKNKLKRKFKFCA